MRHNSNLSKLSLLTPSQNQTDVLTVTAGTDFTELEIFLAQSPAKKAKVTLEGYVDLNIIRRLNRSNLHIVISPNTTLLSALVLASHHDYSICRQAVESLRSTHPSTADWLFARMMLRLECCAMGKGEELRHAVMPYYTENILRALLIHIDKKGACAITKRAEETLGTYRKNSTDVQISLAQAISDAQTYTSAGYTYQHGPNAFNECQQMLERWLGYYENGLSADHYNELFAVHGGGNTGLNIKLIIRHPLGYLGVKAIHKAINQQDTKIGAIELGGGVDLPTIYALKTCMYTKGLLRYCGRTQLARMVNAHIKNDDMMISDSIYCRGDLQRILSATSRVLIGDISESNTTVVISILMNGRNIVITKECSPEILCEIYKSFAMGNGYNLQAGQVCCDADYIEINRQMYAQYLQKSRMDSYESIMRQFYANNPIYRDYAAARFYWVARGMIEEQNVDLSLPEPLDFSPVGHSHS